MKEKKAWNPPGWPWELEILAFIFVVIAIAIPYYVHYMDTSQVTQTSLMESAAKTAHPGETVFSDPSGFLWIAGIVTLYIFHLFLAGSGFALISTPFTHLAAPLAFSLIAYFRIYDLTKGSSKVTTIVSGEPAQMISWALGVVVITLLFARVRMARYMMSFRDTKWDISSPTLTDGSYFQLMAQLRPLVYAPRIYRACDRGILIEGWFYVMPIPFALVQSIGAVSKAALAASGYFMATSVHALIRLELLDNSPPVFISPKDRDAFLKYCAQHVVRLHRGSTTHGSSETKTVRQTNGDIGKA